MNIFLFFHTVHNPTRTRTSHPILIKKYRTIYITTTSLSYLGLIFEPATHFLPALASLWSYGSMQSMPTWADAVTSFATLSPPAAPVTKALCCMVSPAWARPPWRFLSQVGVSFYFLYIIKNAHKKLRTFWTALSHPQLPRCVSER